jgi:hypothetical protein
MGCIVPPEPHPPPPKNFNSLKLPTVEQQIVYYRLNPINYESALYFDRSGRGRFDLPTSSYGICYLGETVEVAFIECFGRQLGAKFVSREFLRTRNLFTIESVRSLKLVNLFGKNLARLGSDSRLTSGDNYEISRWWAEAIYNHPLQVDGIRYFSRHDNTRLCCGLFERVKDSLVERNLGTIIERDIAQLVEILELYDFGID